jgi:cytochrome c553
MRISKSTELTCRLLLPIAGLGVIFDNSAGVIAAAEQPAVRPSGLGCQGQGSEPVQLPKELPTNVILAQAGVHRGKPDSKAASGKPQFLEYCAQCHGQDGTGDGPVAPELKKKPANLTRLSKNNNGVFPEGEVHDFIVGTRTIASHGTREMPVWGYAFMFRQGGLAGPFVPVLTPQEANYRINLLVDYVKSIQQK